MGQPAAKQGDRVVGVDMHMILQPEPDAPCLVPHPFDGLLGEALSPNVRIERRPAATTGSIAKNTPKHVPDGGRFASPPSNQAIVLTGSATVRINGMPAARAGDRALTCNDPGPAPVGIVVADSTVRIGG